MKSPEKALIYDSEIDFISRCVLDYPDIETGGDLFGFWTHSGRPVIHYVIGPGPNSRRTVTFFNQDVNYLRTCGDRLRDLHGLQHIGEWHSHHKLGLCHPSSHDSNTVTNAIRNYQLQRFLLVICTITQSHSDIRGFLYSRASPSAYEGVGWVVLTGQNTLRKAIDEEMADIVKTPKTACAALGVIDRTTLYDDSGEFTTVPEDLWIGTKSGMALFKAIHDELASKIASVRMSLLETRHVSLNWVQESKRHAILFPATSPTPAIYLHPYQDVGQILEWDANEWENASNQKLHELAQSLIEKVKQSGRSLWIKHG